MPVQWSNAKAIRTALAKVSTPNEKFFEGLSAFTKSHFDALLRLTDAELAKLASGKAGVRTLGWVLTSAYSDTPELAVRLIDALITRRNAKHLDLRTAQAALYAAQDDNNHLGVNPERLRRVLDLCVPLAERDPDLYLMASYCAAELAAWDEAFALIAKAKAKRVKGWKGVTKETLFAPAKKDPRFLALFGKKPGPVKPLKPIAVPNAKAIGLFTKYVATHDDAAFGDVYPSKQKVVDFWFANNTKAANKHFQQFATSGDGSLIVMWNTGKGFAKAPVVFLGGEGELAILGAGVADALALLARCGTEVVDRALSYGAEPDDEPSAATLWVETTFGRRVTAQPNKAAAAFGKQLGLAKLKALIKQLDA